MKQSEKKSLEANVLKFVMDNDIVNEGVLIKGNELAVFHVVGDWKHSHDFLDAGLEKFGLTPSYRINNPVDEFEGSDYFDATHIYSIKK